MQMVAVPPVSELEAAPPMPSIPEPDAAAAWTPAGYRAEVVVKNLIYPSSVEFDDRGTMYVAESGYVYGDSGCAGACAAGHAGRTAEAAAGDVRAGVAPGQEPDHRVRPGRP